MSILPLSKAPQPDEAEFNAVFPSKAALAQYTSPRSDLDDADYPQPDRGTRRILVIGVDKRYLEMRTAPCSPPATTRSRRWCRCIICTGPASRSTSRPCRAIRSSLSCGRCPRRTRRSPASTRCCWSSFRKPLRLSEVVAGLGADSDYAAVVIPGGHGPLPATFSGDREVQRDDLSRSRTRGRFTSRSLSMQTRRTVEDAALASEIIQLPNREGYLKRATSPRWARVTFRMWSIQPGSARSSLRQ